MQRKLNTTGLKSLYVPSRIPGPDRLLVVLHGLGDSLEGFKFLPEIFQIPGLNYLLINAPDPYFTGYSWYQYDAAREVMESGVVRSRGLLFQLVKEIKHHGFIPPHVGVLGFSQGCLMALDLACRYPEALGAIVGISGYASHLSEYPEKLSPAAREQKILVTHGTEDPLLPIDQTKAQIKALKGMGLNIEWKSYRKDHTIEPRQEVADIRAFLLRTLCRED
jgi:phospholipase/carboxylesterase